MRAAVVWNAWRVGMGLWGCVGFSGEVSLGQAPAPAQGSGGTLSAGVRTWTSVEGKLFQASLVSSDGVSVVLRLPNGQTGAVALGRLSAGDREFVLAASGKVPPGGTAGGIGGGGKGVPVERRVWPQRVEVDGQSVEVKVVGEASNGQDNLYHSRSFEFIAQDKIAVSVMKEVARTFEATRALVEALPWGVEAVPPADLGYYRAKLYKDRRGYLAEGGPEHSGGVYFRKDRIFRVPFESLGLELRGKTWFKNEAYRNFLLVHEVTHQMMHDVLPFLPIWASEGTAEYAAMLPYNAGRFLAGSHERGMKEYIRMRGNLQEVGSPMELLTMSREQWHARADKGGREQERLYFGACALVYFFSHLDGNGKGADFIAYMEKLREAQAAWALFFKNPQVEHFPDGSYRYPAGVKPPGQEYSEKTGMDALPLLVKGRDEETLKRAFYEGYKKIGVR
ncbi:MAG: hypothetical protein RLZZ244_506 [Verrucomicrobiota bacterium]